jgi:ADP-ribosyl-[dinitrogen reductase] hydrolase
MRAASARRTEPTGIRSSGIGLRERAVGAYLGLAVGDALGATVEFMTPREIRAKHGLHERIVGGGWLNLRVGAVTDDTEMSLALGASILREGGIEADAVAEAYSAWMRGKPIDVGHTVRRGIVHYRRSGESAVPYSEQGAGNGACMRTLPVALATLGASRYAVVEATLAQAHVTHNNHLSDAGTLLVVELVQAALRGEDLHTLELRVDDFIAGCPEFDYRRVRRLDNPSGYIVDTLQVVLEALFTHRGFRPAMIATVNRGGDADTTGAILGMIAGALWGVQAIPRTWIERLDRGVAKECETQARELLELDRVRPQPT